MRRSISRLLPLLTLTLPLLVHAQAPRTPVLVELFTSEGCSSCPPADELLAQLDHDQPIPNADIIILGEHVDYWDNLGWHDRFSSIQFTERQTAYGQRLHTEGPYTPQMIVNGTTQFVGNDASSARAAIQRAAEAPHPALALSQPSLQGRSISATVTFASAEGQRGDLYAALVDPTDTTSVRGGENGGRQLHHAGVVRVLQRIGPLDTQPHTFTLNAPKDADPAFMRVVVFAQQRNLGPILGAAAASVTPQSHNDPNSQTAESMRSPDHLK